MYLSSMPWDEAEAALRRCKVAMLPLGAAAKEHGLHLPLNNDALLADYLAARVAERVDVIVLPTLTYGYYPAFVEYPGSIHLELSTQQAVLMDIARSMARHGCRRLYVLNTGISTCRPLEAACVTLADEGIRLEYTRLEAIADVERQVQEQEGGTHADELETSMMLACAPHVVRMERARKDYSPGQGPLTRTAGGAGVYSPTGAWGDPTLATAEKGRVLLDALIAHVVASLQALGSD